jgi:hypothetical protein
VGDRSVLDLIRRGCRVNVSLSRDMLFVCRRGRPRPCDLADARRFSIGYGADWSRGAKIAISLFALSGATPAKPTLDDGNPALQAGWNTIHIRYCSKQNPITTEGASFLAKPRVGGKDANIAAALVLFLRIGTLSSPSFHSFPANLLIPSYE